MSHRLRTFLGVCASFVVAIAAVPATPTLVMRTITSAEGVTTEYRATLEQLRRAKAWSVDSLKPPPLTVEAAISIARKHAKPSDVTDLFVTSVELQRTGSSSGAWWHYVVNFYDKEDAFGPEPPDMREVVILLDGTVIKGVQSEPPRSSQTSSNPRPTRCSGSNLFSYFEGKRYTFCVSAESLRSLPRWAISSTTNPPLAPSAASASARRALAKLVTNAADWSIAQVALYEGSPDAWFYVVSFTLPPKEISVGAEFGSINVPVLMNGTSPVPSVDATSVF
jgi:hypothetical protein